MVAVLSGGERLRARLAAMAAAVQQAQTVRVGFLEGSAYPDGTSLPMVAAVQEFGGTVPAHTVPAHTVTIYRRLLKDGSLADDGRFVKASKSNFATTHQVAAYQVPQYKIPARPYFRGMIKKDSPAWGDQVAKALKGANYNSSLALARMGALIAGQLRESISTFSGVPLAPATIARKGFDKQLVDTGHMLQSVDFEIKR